MADDSFEHDADHFESAPVPGGVDLADAEARYADLFAEIIWDGTITADKRERLRTAAATFELAAARIDQIESSLMAAHQARNQFAVVDETQAALPEGDNGELLDEEPPSERFSVAPLAPAVEPGMLALQKRIGVLEEQLYHSELDKQHQQEHIDALERLVEQLQFALESTLEELDDTHRQLDANNEDGAPAAPPPQRSLARARSGAYGDDPPWDGQTLELPARTSQRRNNPDELYRKLLDAPRDAELLHALFKALGRGEDVDRRWCIAHALDFLGETDSVEKDFARARTPDQLVRPSRAVNDDEWRELLFHPDEDRLIGEIFSAVAPAVLLGHLTAMRASVAPEVVDPDKLVEPQSSTLQAVRCLAWAAAFLGLEAPPIYVDAEFRGAAELVLSPTPSTLVGKLALSGREPRELAFVAGFHLAWFRREHLLGKPHRSTRGLEDLFLAALMIGNPGLPMTGEVKQRVEPIARTIRPLLDKRTVEQLQDCFSRFVEAGGRTNLSRWLRSVNRTAACAGLLLCNDLSAAHRMLALLNVPKREAAMDELVLFFTSGRCTLLRRRIGIAIE